MENVQAAITPRPSGMSGKFVNVCMTIITLCCTLMVTFVWDLRSDFSAEKQKSEGLKTDVVEIKGEV